MLFNYDSLPTNSLVVTAILVGGLLSYSFYNIFTTMNNDSLINTTATQTSTLDSISESTNTSILANPQYVDVGVQTEPQSTWQIVKEWFIDTFSINSSEITSIGNTRVNKWVSELDSSQSTPSQNTISEISHLNLSDTIQVADSASNVSEVVSESSLQNLAEVGDSVSNNFNFTENVLLNYAKSQDTLDIGSRAEYFNSISPELEVDLLTVTENGLHYMFVVINDVILTISPNIFDFFI
jgi:hypothetical protein